MVGEDDEVGLGLVAALLPLSLPLMLGCCLKKVGQNWLAKKEGRRETATKKPHTDRSKSTSFIETLPIPPSATMKTAKSSKTQATTCKKKSPPPLPSGSGTTEDMESQLSEYEGRPRGTKAKSPGRLPEIPESSERGEAKPRQAPLRFAKKGRVKLIPMDQKEAWIVDKRRLVPAPERRAHVVRTIRKMGGWLIDREAPPAGRDEQGEKKVNYVYVQPKPDEPKPTAH